MFIDWLDIAVLVIALAGACFLGAAAVWVWMHNWQLKRRRKRAFEEQYRRQHFGIKRSKK